MSTQVEGLAKISWEDPTDHEIREYVLMEGATATIGRSSANDITIPERHVSRQHAVINYREGIFTISDLGSANKTFVNDRQIDEPFPLAHGDIIRLYVRILTFSAMVTEEEEQMARTTGTLITAAIPSPNGLSKLIVTAGAQEGTEFKLYQDNMT